MYKNSELIVGRNIRFVGEISYNLPKDLFGTYVYKTLASC